MPRTAFISGPIAPPAGYFVKHYEQRILDAIAAGDNFVTGPAPGMDTEALEFLCSRPDVEKSRIMVHLTRHEDTVWRGRYKKFEQEGGNVRAVGITTGERDAEMTESSDYDILRYMPVEEAKAFYGAAWFPKITQTEKNEQRRRFKDGGEPPTTTAKEEKEDLRDKMTRWLERR